MTEQVASNPPKVASKTARKRKPAVCADCKQEYKRLGHAPGCLWSSK